MDFSKIKFRFKQFGGWRLIKAFTQIGVLPLVIKEILRVVVSHRPLKEAYPAVRRKVAPVLMKKYAPLIDELCQKYDRCESEHLKNDVVWFCWMQGLEQAPSLVKACYVSLKRYISDKEIVVISAENYKDFVTIPKDLEEKHQKGIIPFAHFTDLIRLELLINHGGTWIDSTVLCLNENYPKEMMDCNLFFFQYFDKDSGRYQGISNWFISAYRNNKLLMILRDMLYRYWRDYNCLLDYYVFHLFFNMIAKFYPDKIQEIPKVNSNNALQMVFHLKDKYSDSLINYFSCISSFHKLDYRVKIDENINTDSLYNYILKEYIY